MEIRLQLIRSGNWEDTKFFMRYFQPSGKGELKTAKGMKFLPNDLYEMPEEVFRLYYTSLSTEQQVIDLYFFNSFGKMYTLSFSFSNEKQEEEETIKEDEEGTAEESPKETINEIVEETEEEDEEEMEEIEDETVADEEAEGIEEHTLSSDTIDESPLVAL